MVGSGIDSAGVMAKHRDEVFVAGGEPTVTYVKREELHVERNFARAVAFPNHIVSLSAPSKSGKTVLCRRVLGGREYVWVEGGQAKNTDELWSHICSELNIPAERKVSESAEEGIKVDGKILIVTAGGSRLEKKAEDKTYKTNNMSDALKRLVADRICLVIDDFHYLPDDARVAVMRNIKGSVFSGLKVVLLSVAHRSFDAIKAETELTGRFSAVTLPPWSIEDLEQIARQGFEELGVSISAKMIKKLAEEAQESPFLMQRFCWELCFEHGIERRKLLGKYVIPETFDVESMYAEIAKDAGLPMYQKLVAGPQSRKIRVKRPLSAGQDADIYECILLAIAATGPQQNITYDELRTKLNSLLIDQVPAKHEITSALKHLTVIGWKFGEDSVIDWDDDKRTISVADPYLRFFLRWQVRTRAQ